MKPGAFSAVGQIYPVYCFPKAPTYQKWVKLTAADVQHLRQEPGFEGQNVYFYLNHPIEHIYLIGPIVAIEHIVTKYNTHIFTLELDDGSGKTIEVRLPLMGRNRQKQTHVEKESTHVEKQSSSSSSEDSSADERKPSKIPAALVPQNYETTIQDLKITTSLASGLQISLNNHPITIGTVLKAKGTLSTFRDAFQLNLQRAFIVHSLGEEIAAWEAYAKFARSVLSKPWVLTDAEIKVIEEERLRGFREERRNEGKRKEYERRYEEWERRKREREVRRELRRVREAEVLDGNSLDRVRRVPGKGSARVPSYEMCSKQGEAPSAGSTGQQRAWRLEELKQSLIPSRALPHPTKSSAAAKAMLMPPIATPKFRRPYVPIDGAWLHELSRQVNPNPQYKKPSRIGYDATSGRADISQ